MTYAIQENQQRQIPVAQRAAVHQEASRSLLRQQRLHQEAEEEVMRRLKQNEIKAYREELLEKQGGMCALCGEQLFRDDAVLDHHHKMGWVRGVLHRGCNALLGKIENNHKRMGVPSLDSFLGGCADYIRDGLLPICKDGQPVYHPSHRTPDEKRLLRNKRARRKRKAAKGQ